MSPIACEEYNFNNIQLNAMTRHILLVEQEQQEQQFFDAALHQLYTDIFLMHAETPDSALKILTQFRPDIVFISTELPNKSLQLLKQIRRLKSCARLPVYIYTKVIDSTLGLSTIFSYGAGCLLKTRNKDYLKNSLHGIFSVET